MQEEIFGPLLPVLTFYDIEEAIQMVNARPRPLALYYFTKDKQREAMMLKQVSYGGGCINDTIVHLATSHMPFGGVGNSGMGGYHGKDSFDTFTHKKEHYEEIGTSGYSNPVCTVQEQIEYIKEADVGHYAQIRKDIKKKKAAGAIPMPFLFHFVFILLTERYDRTENS